MSAINLNVLFKVMLERTNWLEFNVKWDDIDVLFVIMPYRSITFDVSSIRNS